MTIHIRSKLLLDAWEEVEELNSIFSADSEEVATDNMKKFSSGILAVENGTSTSVPFPDIDVPRGVYLLSDQDITISVNGGSPFPCSRPNEGTDDHPTYARFFLEGVISSIVIYKPDVDTGSLLDDATANVRYAVWGDAEGETETVTPTTIVQGPAESVDNALARFNGTTGGLIQSSTATLDDGGNLTVTTVNGEDPSDLADRIQALEASPGGGGDVVGPASSTDNALARFDGTTGKLIQNSSATIDDSGNLTAGLLNTIDIVDLEARVGIVEGGGVVTGPGVSVADLSVALWDGTSGITIRDSAITVDFDDGSISLPDGSTVDGRDVSADGSTLDTHVAASAPHSGHEDKANKDAANGYAGLSASTKISGSQQTYGTAANTACEGNDSRLSDSRAPTGSAGGDLTGSYPNPTIALLAVTAAKIALATITDAQVAAANKDGASGTASMRTLGNGAAQACAGNDSRLSDSRAPNGSAGGDLGGTYPSPTVTQARGLRETAGPTTLTLGAVADGQGLVRSGSTIIGQATAGGVLTADGDVLTRSSGVLSKISIGLSGQRLTVVSGLPSWQYVFNPSRELVFYTDFLESTGGVGLTFTNFSQTASFATADRWGIVQFANTTVTQGSIIGTNAAAYVGGSTGELYYETSFRVPELSDATDTYTLYIGFGDVTAGGDSTDAIEFRYTHSVASGAWQGVTRNNSSETTATGGSTVTVAASTWYRLGIAINAAWTSVEFFVDGVSIGTCTTNIPTGGSRAFCVLTKVDRTAAPSSASRIFACDYIFFRKAVSR